MSRLSDSRGNALVLALMATLVIGVIATATFARTRAAEERTARTKHRDRATESSDSALEMAIAKIQRNGSTSADERSCSKLDGPVQACYDASGNPNPNGANQPSPGNLNADDAKDGKVAWKIRSIPDTNDRDNDGDRTERDPGKLKQRLIVATGTFNDGYRDIKRTRRLVVNVVPRVLRYALYAGGENLPAGATTAIGVGESGSDDVRLYLPPNYKTAENARGGDVGSNKAMSFGAGARVNERSLAPSFYDNMFLPSGSTANTDRTKYYGGLPWGVFTRAPKSSGQTLTPWNVNIASAATVNMAGQPRTLATATAFPDYTQLVAAWRTTATGNTDPALTAAGVPDGNMTRAEFNTWAASNRTVSGYLYVDCRADPGVATVSATLQITGSLVMHGCDLNVTAAGQLIVKRPFERNPDENGNGIDDTQEADGSLHQKPALILLPHGVDAAGNPRWGNATFQSNATKTSSLDGFTYVGGNMLISATTRNATSGNFRSNGAVAVRGRFTATGQPTIIMRWNPAVQDVDFDASTDGRMGTYTLKTADRPPPDKPTVKLNSPLPPATYDWWPADPVQFTWTTTGELDYTECRHIADPRGDGDTEDSGWGACSAPYTLPTLLRDADHQVCVRVGNASGRVQDCYSFYVMLPPPEVTITSSPSDPSLDRTPDFAWTIKYSYTSVDCKLDNGSYQPCTGTYAHTVADTTPTAQTPSIGYGSHTMTIRACNPTGCNTAARTWTLNPETPVVTFTSTPANPQAYAASPSWNFKWTTQSPAATIECQLDSGSWTACAGTGYTISYSSCANHTFRVRVTNVTGSSTGSYPWHANCAPPTVSITSVPPSYYRSWGTFNYTTTNATSATCWNDWGNGYHACSLTNAYYNNKPNGTGNWQVCVTNSDGSASACASSQWSRIPTQTYTHSGSGDGHIYCGDMDCGDPWSNAGYGECGAGERWNWTSDQTGAGAANGFRAYHGRAHQVPWSGNYACVITPQYIARGDDQAWLAAGDFYGSTIVGYLDSGLQVWDGTQWVEVAWCGDGCEHTDNVWRWYRVGGAHWPGYWKRIRWFTGARQANCNVTWTTGTGCGARYDALFSTTDEAAGWPYLGLQG